MLVERSTHSMPSIPSIEIYDVEIRDDSVCLKSLRVYAWDIRKNRMRKKTQRVTSIDSNLTKFFRQVHACFLKIFCH